MPNGKTSHEHIKTPGYTGGIFYSKDYANDFLAIMVKSMKIPKNQSYTVENLADFKNIV